jgi:beta-glucosidase
MLALYDEMLPDIHANDLAMIAVPTDFLGVNYYNRAVIKDDPAALPLRFASVRPDGEYTAMDWEVYPDALRALLVRLTRDYAPAKLYITENGAAYDDMLAPDGAIHDEARTRYLAGHLAAVHAAIGEGVPLAGYFAWSLMDNFEWAEGYNKRFGIVHVDYATQRRTPKDSARFFSAAIERNGLE